MREMFAVGVYKDRTGVMWMSCLVDETIAIPPNLFKPRLVPKPPVDSK